MGNGWSAIPCNKDKEIVRVPAEFKDKEVIIDGENKKEHEHLVPNTKVICIAINRLTLIFQTIL
jgi:hypothetical protein